MSLLLLFAGTVEAAESIRGHVGKRRRGYTPIYEESLTATVSVPEIALVPEPIAYFDPPADRLAGIDSSLERIKRGLAEIEVREAKKEATRKRRKKEEEAILRFLSTVD